jgi:NAD-dependent deacetylase
MRERCVILSGSGISAESGLPTFRGAGGLWQGYSVYELATPEAWAANPERVLDFYTMRRSAVRAALPNAGHHALVQLEARFDTRIITQNIDDLHERAGSSRVLHLHGEIRKARSSIDPAYVRDLGDGDIRPGDRCPRGGQLRPHVVWFGEDVPEMATAIEWVEQADVFIVVGTSLHVYPASSLLYGLPDHCRKFIVDPTIPDHVHKLGFEAYNEPAAIGLPRLVAAVV